MTRINLCFCMFRIPSYPLLLKCTKEGYSISVTSLRYSINQTFISINNRELIFLMELKESTILN